MTGTTERFAFDPASNRVPVRYDEPESNDPFEFKDRAFSADTSTKSKQWKRTETLKTHDKQLGYYYDRHGRIKNKTEEPLGKDGEVLRQSGNAIVGYRKTLTCRYNANDELEKTVLLEQRGFEVKTTTTHYRYDAFGRRIAKHSEVQNKYRLTASDRFLPFERAYQGEKTKKQTTLFLWDGNRQIQEYKDGLTFTTIYEQNSFEPVARFVSDENELKIYHYHNDHLGTPNELTDSEGNVVWLADYNAWGGVSDICKDFSYTPQSIGNVEISSEDLQPIRFQGQFYDTETGLHYNRFRYYDPDLSMFISRDPIGLMGGNNVFAYAPNPTGWIDPFGLAKVEHFDNFDDARRSGFEKAGMTDPDKIEFSKYDEKTGTVVEFKGEGGAKVAYDSAHADMDASQGHDKPHVGWQTAGKRSSGGASRGNNTYSGDLHPHRPDKKTSC